MTSAKQALVTHAEALHAFEAAVVLLQLSGRHWSFSPTREAETAQNQVALQRAKYATIDELIYMTEIFEGLAAGGKGYHNSNICSRDAGRTKAFWTRILT